MFLKSASYLSMLFISINISLHASVTLVGPICFADGIGRQTISAIECIKDAVPVYYVSSRDVTDLHDVPASIKSILTNSHPRFGDVLLFEDVLDFYDSSLKDIPCDIKIAYSMYEKEQLPNKWVTILNDYFDLVVVPDECLVSIYQKSGVTIPIFVLPLSLYLEPFLQKPVKTEPNKPFTFGTSGLLSDRKNQLCLLEAFAQAFGNDPNVCLKIHGRSGNNYAEALRTKIRQLHLENVELIEKSLSWSDYVEFLSSLDCFVSVSRGEGFSITPREAMALGIPCILTDNMAHHTLCKTDLVKTIKSFKKPCLRSGSYDDHEPFDFFCTIKDVYESLKDLLCNFFKYSRKAMVGRWWVQRYSHDRLAKKYQTLVCPQEVVLGPCNEIHNNYLMTNSIVLFKKYSDLQDKYKAPDA